MNAKTILDLQGVRMYELPRTIPDVKMLLALASEELRSTAQGLIVPDMENGQYGWLVLSRRARWKTQRISKASRLTV